MESVYSERYFLALDFSGLKDEISHFSKIALNILPITKTVPSPTAPKANIGLKPCTYGIANRTISTGVVGALPPLMVKFGALVGGYDVLAFWFSQFKILADPVNDDPAFPALQNVGKPTVGQLVTKVAEVKRF